MAFCAGGKKDSCERRRSPACRTNHCNHRWPWRTQNVWAIAGEVRLIVKQPLRTANPRGILIITVSACTLALLAQTSTGRNALQSAGLVKRPSGYTSLAFQDPTFLPEHLAFRMQHVRIAFVVHNSASESRIYTWRLATVHGHHNERRLSGRIRIASGGSATISRRTAISCSSGRVLIMVTLKTPPESIDAWATCSSRKR